METGFLQPFGTEEPGFCFMMAYSPNCPNSKWRKKSCAAAWSIRPSRACRRLAEAAPRWRVVRSLTQQRLEEAVAGVKLAAPPDSTRPLAVDVHEVDHVRLIVPQRNRSPQR